MSTENDSGGVVSAGLGAVAGAGGAVAAVAAAGPVAGLGAAGITSGLAAIGSFVVGGGMAAGLATVAAAPIAAGCVGYGLYKLSKRILKQMDSEAS